MRLKPPSEVKLQADQVDTCSCGAVRIEWFEDFTQVRIRGAWMQKYRFAVCFECNDKLRIGPDIILVDKDGEEITKVYA